MNSKPDFAQNAAAPTLRSLQIARFFAASVVVFYHTHSAVSFGQFGVDIFFPLSGYVIFLVLSRPIKALKFIEDRLTRIIPLYFVCTTALLVLTAYQPELLDHTRFNIGNYLKSIFFVPYFRETGALNPMLGVGWTLNYEMFFYVSCLTAFALGAAGQVTRLAYVAGFISALLAAGLLLHSSSVGYQFFANTIVFEFLMGAALFVFQARFPNALRIPPRAALAGAMAVFVALSLIEIYCPVNFDVPGTRFIYFGLPACVLIFLLAKAEPILSGNNWLLKLMRHLGDASYATYLTHLYVLQFVDKILPARIASNLRDSGVRWLVLLIAASAVGSLAYRWIDKPSVRFARRLAARFRRPVPLSQSAQGGL